MFERGKFQFWKAQLPQLLALRVEDWILVGKFLVSGPRGNQESTRAGRGSNWSRSTSEGWFEAARGVFFGPFLQDFFVVS